MARLIQPGEVGLILVPFIAARTNDENAVDGFEDDLVHKLEDDDLVEEALMARVLVIGCVDEACGPCEREENATHETLDDTKETLRDRALDAADVAAALLKGDAEVRSLLAPWFAKQGRTVSQ